MQAGSIPPPALLLDTTLRDGEQAPGVALTPDEKAAYVRLAEEVGIRYIEIGFPQNGLDYQACKAAAAAASKSRLVAMSLTTREGVERVVETGAHEILFVVPSSSSHLKNVYGRTLAELIRALLDAILFARSHGLLVNVGLEDAGELCLQIIATILTTLRGVAESIDCITVPDTRGQLVPSQVTELLTFFRGMTGDLRWRLAFHAHDDLGLATANSLAALELKQPVDCIHVTACGFGERAGNASLEQVAVLAQKKLGMPTGLDLKGLRALAQLAASSFLIPVHPLAPIVGERVFKHESGLHQRGLLNDASTYQCLSPADFGAETTLVLGKHTGRRLRQVIAAQAGCSENDVLDLQRSITNIDKTTLNQEVRRLWEQLGTLNFVGCEAERAVAEIRERLNKRD